MSPLGSGERCRMIKGKAPAEVKPVRGANELTMDEAWKIARPRMPGLNSRI
jgi:hypothetical protein